MPEAWFIFSTNKQGIEEKGCSKASNLLSQRGGKKNITQDIKPPFLASEQETHFGNFFPQNTKTCRSRNTGVLVLSLIKHGPKVALRNERPRGQRVISEAQEWFQIHLTWKIHPHQKARPVQYTLWKNFSRTNLLAWTPLKENVLLA